jgi:cytochrome c553
MAAAQNPNYPRPQGQLPMSVGQQLQAFGASSSKFGRDIPVASNENARSFKQASNFFAQAAGAPGPPPQYKQGEARNQSPSGLKNQQLYVI